MAETLLLRMPREAGDLASWMIIDERGRMALAPQTGALAEAAATAAGRRVVVLLPAADVLLTEADLPTRASAAKLQQIVPFALEEQLADDIDQLHFAVGRRAPQDARTPVAVIGRALLEDTLAALAAAGLAPAALHAEHALLPAGTDHPIVLIEHDQLLIAAPGGLPVVLPAGDLEGALEMADARHEDTGSATTPPGMQVYASPADWQRYRAEVEALRERRPGIKVQLLPAGPLPLLGQQLPDAKPVNLLQGRYAPATEMAGDWRRWRVAAILLAALIGLHVASQAWQLARLKRVEREIDASIEEVFRTAMPGETSAGDARRRMEQRLLTVRSGGQGTLLPALSALAQARGAAADATLQGLSYSAGTLDLRVRAPDAASVDRINQQLRASGWQSELTAGNAGQEGYQGRIQMRAAGS